MIKLDSILVGHILVKLKEIDSESIDCVVTSPPYYGLRSYKTEPQIWLDGKPDCGQHEWTTEKIAKNSGGGWNDPEKRKDYPTMRLKNPDKETDKELSQGNFCIHCNAWQGELGLEPSFELYLQHLWQIFDEIKRVLKKTGTCWVNLGDSYGGSGGSTGHTSETKNLGRKTFDYGAYPTIEHTKQYQAKSLLNIPSRFAIGMTDRGWILRNEIIWYKRSCMPSSAKDRFTVDFEKIFFFTKNKKYYFEQQFDTAAYDGRKDTMFKGSAKYNDEEINPGGGVHTFAKQGHQRWSKRKLDEQSGLRKHSGYDVLDNPYVRNKRCVWDVVPEPEKEAHFACFPQKLIEPMIKAGCPEKGIVLDPFFGSGTTGVVAKKLNRNFIGVELQEKYVEIAHKKFNRELGMFNTL